MLFEKWFLRKTTHGISGIVHAAHTINNVKYALCNSDYRNLLPVENIGVYSECRKCNEIIVRFVKQRMRGKDSLEMDWKTWEV